MIRSINLLDKRRQQQQMQAYAFSHHVKAWFQNKSLLMIGVLLLPAFFVGWKSGRHPISSKGLKQFGKFMLLTLITHAKKV